MTTPFIRLTSSPSSLPADTNVHFPSNGAGGLTAAVATMTAVAATYTKNSATGTGGVGNVGAVGATGYAFTSGGWFAPYKVTTAGVNGTISVESWLHFDESKDGQVPTGTLSLHTASVLGNMKRVWLEGLAIRGNITGITTLTITEPNGTALFVIKVPVAPTPQTLTWPRDGMDLRGPFGVIVSAAGQLDADLLFNFGMPKTMPHSAGRAPI